MVVRQGELYWIDLGIPVGSEPGYRRPYVVVQSDAFNRTEINTVVMCPLTSNTRLTAMPGNVTLDAGEANLERASVVNVSQIVTIDRRRLGAPIGILSPARVRQIIAGVRLVTRPADSS